MSVHDRIEFRLNKKGLRQNLLFLCFCAIIFFLPLIRLELESAPLAIKVFEGICALLLITMALAVVLKPHMVIDNSGIRFNPIKFSFPMNWDDIEGYELEKDGQSEPSSTHIAIHRHGRGIMPFVRINLEGIRESDKLIEIISHRLNDRNKGFHYWGDPNQADIITQISEPPPANPIDYKEYNFSRSGIEYKGKIIRWSQVKSVLYPDLFVIGGFGSLVITYSDDGINKTLSLPASSSQKYRSIALSIVHNAQNAYIQQSLVDELK